MRSIPIPAGVDDQTRVRVPGEGEPSPSGGPSGDLYCDISVEEHALFQRHGQDLIVRVPITYTQAALGTTIEAPSLDGRKELTIPPGTQSGEVFKIRGFGLPTPRGRGKGNLLVEVVIEVPKSLPRDQEKLLRELAEAEKKNVSPHQKSFLEKVREFFVSDEESQSAEK